MAKGTRRPVDCQYCHSTQCGDWGRQAFNRRSFIAGLGSITSGFPDERLSPRIGSEAGGALALQRPPLRVQPVFINAPRNPQPRTSWRYSAEIYDEHEASVECSRVTADLEGVVKRADFPIELLPLQRVQRAEQAGSLTDDRFDVLVVFPASRNPEVIDLPQHDFVGH